MDIFNANNWTNKALLNQLTAVAARGDGWAHSFGPVCNRVRLRVLKAATLARSEGKTPPFKRGAKVKAINTASKESCLDPDTFRYGEPILKLKKGRKYSVHSMHYQGSGVWHVALNELKDDTKYGYFLYDAKHLELVP